MGLFHFLKKVKSLSKSTNFKYNLKIDQLQTTKKKLFEKKFWTTEFMQKCRRQ